MGTNNIRLNRQTIPRSNNTKQGDTDTQSINFSKQGQKIFHFVSKCAILITLGQILLIASVPKQKKKMENREKKKKKPHW